MSQEFYVYVYKRPDGVPFYVGKGVLRRVYSLSPSRRTKHFMNVVAKYGRDNILLEYLKCGSEEEAFAWEVRLIEAYRRESVNLINITNGGEGVSGRKATPRMRENLAKWQGAYASLSEDAKQRILDGLARGRAKNAEWRKTEAGIAHNQRLQELGKLNLAIARRPKLIICACCGAETVKYNVNARCCSKLCQQRERRSRGGK